MKWEGILVAFGVLLMLALISTTLRSIRDELTKIRQDLDLAPLTVAAERGK